MMLTSLKKLGNFNKIILSDSNIDYNSIIQNSKNENEKILVLITSEKFPKAMSLLKKNRKNLTFYIFSWSLFCHRHYEMWQSDLLSINNSKKIYEKVSKKNKLLISFIKKIYNSNDVSLCFEKIIASNLKDYYEKIKIYDLIKEYNSNVVPIVNKKNYLYFEKFGSNGTAENLSSDFNKQVLFYKSKSYINFFYDIFIFIFYPFIALLSIRKFSIKKIKKNIGLRIYKHGIGFNENSTPLDWIIDNNHFSKKNSLFIFEDKPNINHVKGLVDKKYDFHFCSNRIPLKKCSLFFFFKILFIYIPSSIVILPILFFSDRLIRKEIIFAWIKFFAWKNFISIYNINTYLSYHNYNSDHIYRNIFLKKTNCLTIMYKHSHSAIVFDYKNKDKYGYVDFMNSFYDIEYHWSKCGIEMSKLNKSRSKEFLISGPIWSSNQFINKKYMINNKEKISLAFFTTNFLGFFAVNPLEAHERFLLLALETIKNYPNINITFKPKHDLALYDKYEKTRELIKNLYSHKNFKVAENKSFSTRINENSDVVISMSFASSGFEAMCLGKKSFYVDLTNVYNNSYYDNFQKLVSHSNKEALDNLEHWMKVDKKDVLSKYKDIFENLNIWNNTNNASEIIKNRIIENLKK